MAAKPVIRKTSNTIKGPATKRPVVKTPSRMVSKTATKGIDLSKLFGTVAKTMTQNKTSLNEADTYNHDHGDHMAQIFKVITNAVAEKKEAAPSAQLSYASKVLKSQSQSGSAKLYAEGLSEAATQLKGSKAVTANSAMTLIQSLLGAKGSVPVTQTETQSGGVGDLLGGLLGSLTGGSQEAAQPQNSGTGDLLGSLLGSLTGAQSQQAAPAQAQPAAKGQIDIGSLLNAGMAFMQSKQAGGSNLDAILNAVVSSSKMSSSAHHSQSGTLVANTLMQTVGKLLGKK